MNTIQTLARYLSELSIHELPESALSSARHCLLDGLGCAAAGHSHPAVLNARRWASEAFPSGDATIWFTSRKLSSRGAAFVNAYAASVLDIDDGHRAASGHPGAAVIPAVFTVAEAIGADMESVLLAIVCGYEAGLRTAQARDPALLRSVATGRWSAVAAAAGVSKLLALPADAFAHALAIAESQAPNMMAADHAGFAGSDTKEGIPWSVLTGISAVEQAMHGLRGYLGALDNPAIYLPGAAVAGLGQSWLIETTYFKRYGCCRWIHSAIDAVLEMRESGLRAGDIERLEVATFPRAINLANERRPTDVIAAQFSIPFCIAVALIDGADGLTPLDPELLLRSDIGALADRIEMRCDDALGELFPSRVPARVTVQTSGSTLESEVLVPLGDPSNPMSRAQVLEKMNKLLKLAENRSTMSDLAPHLLSTAPRTHDQNAASLKLALSFVRVAVAKVEPEISTVG